MPHALLTACLLGPLLAATAGSEPTESPRFVPVRPLQAEDGRCLKRNRAGKVVEVVCDGVQVPITDPVFDCAVARAADGGGLVVLAGGIRESLDLYLADGRGALRQYRTLGGRRLPTTFNGGLGSWPVTEGLDLVLFAYEQDGQIRFRALDLAGRVHAARQLPIAVSGFEVQWVGDCQAVRVVFDAAGGGGESIQFPHPTAAHLDVGSQQLVFADVPPGRTAERELVLRNRGGRALELHTQLEGSWFALRHAAPAVLEPGQEAQVVVVFEPQRAGEQKGQLELRASGAVAQAVVTLQGRGVAAGPALFPLRVAATASEPLPEAALLAPPPAPAAPAPPFDVQVIEGGDGSVAVRGRFVAGSAPGTALVVHNLASAVQETGEPGCDRVAMAAKAGDQLAVASESGSLRSAWVMLEPLPPSLRIASDGSLLLRVRPGQPYLLCAVATADGPRGHAVAEPGIARPLQTWRGQADASGQVRLARAALGCEAQAFDLVVVIAGPRGPLRSNVLRVAR